MEQLMRWPAKRFEHFFHRFLVRQACEDLKADRDRMLLALDSNSVWWEGENATEMRHERSDAIHRSYKEGVEFLQGTLHGKHERSKTPDPMENDPLFKPLRDQAYTVGETIGPPVPEQAGMGAALIG